MQVVLYVMVTLLGLAVGSFLNVVIHRVPRGESVVSPASRCPSCGKPVRARHNLPVFGWLVLRGRCADCGAPIGVRYPLVELGTALVFLVVAVRMWQLGLVSALPAYLYFAAAGIALALIDLDVRRLPSAIILPSYPVLAALLAVSSAVRDDWWSLGRAGIGAAALFAFYFLLALVYPAGMGFGDVRLSGLLGGVLAYLSWSTLVVGAFGGFVLGALVGAVVLAAGRGDRKTALPFGPFMILGALLALFVAEPIADWYLVTVGWTS
ncbi:prepilin peptidase [Actinokineospora xionganensis]|uniref:Prepilin peptidase n=1 Tax=Actinokineospora xionganensis TaxID=2684470 RepID=A0ABR7KZ79_9PSEU|nr:A24 family peptidase [Actinokineospora xionganensis]MBC6445674.1 prepilin peptidase [Actinokineospora xionganensis]